MKKYMPKLKVSLVNTGGKRAGALFAYGLSSYFDVSLYDLGAITIPYEEDFDYDIVKDINKEVPINLYDIGDVCLFLDHGSISVAADFRDHFKKTIMIMQILDFPTHVKNITGYTYDTWELMKKHVYILNGFIYSKDNVKLFLKHSKQLQKPLLRSFYPVYFKKSEQICKEPFVVYCGRLDEDRRIEEIIDSMQYVNLKLVLVSSFPEHKSKFLDMAKQKNVELEIVLSPSEQEKFNIYGKCSAVVFAGHDQCPGACVIEGMSLGKNAAIFEKTPELFYHYGEYVEYADGTIEGFSKAIIRAVNNDENKQKRIDHSEKFSFDIWAKNVFNFIELLVKIHDTSL